MLARDWRVVHFKGLLAIKSDTCERSVLFSDVRTKTFSILFSQTMYFVQQAFKPPKKQTQTEYSLDKDIFTNTYHSNTQGKVHLAYKDKYLLCNKSLNWNRNTSKFSWYDTGEVYFMFILNPILKFQLFLLFWGIRIYVLMFGARIISFFWVWIFKVPN